jgi:hypothetical protein
MSDALRTLYPNIVTTQGDIAYDAEGNIVQYDEQAVQQLILKFACKDKAKALLVTSDWSVLPDVQITNKAAFDNYRAILRGYVISPVTDPTWPTEPQPVWG